MGRHVVLLGDSVFDNAVYVPGEDPVVDQFLAEMPPNWQVTLLAKDGDVTSDVDLQLEHLPADATDLVISVGGNDALQHAELIERTSSAADLLELLQEVMPRFCNNYAAMLDNALQMDLNTVVCTIYDQCPFPKMEWREMVPIALSCFNDCIVREADSRHVRVIELREICTEPEDYSALSPIEPSYLGGIKIVFEIIRVLQDK